MKNVNITIGPKLYNLKTLFICFMFIVAISFSISSYADSAPQGQSAQAQMVKDGCKVGGPAISNYSKTTTKTKKKAETQSEEIENAQEQGYIDWAINGLLVAIYSLSII